MQDTNLGHQRLGRTATSMWVCWAYRGPRNQPYLEDLAGQECSKTLRPHGMPTHCCGKHLPSLTHQSDCKKERISAVMTVETRFLNWKLKLDKPQGFDLRLFSFLAAVCLINTPVFGPSSWNYFVISERIQMALEMRLVARYLIY